MRASPLAGQGPNEKCVIEFPALVPVAPEALGMAEDLAQDPLGSG
jgi:hypothetical protein